MPGVEAYWALDSAQLLARLGSRTEGLSAEEAANRLSAYGRNELREQRLLSRLSVLSNQLRNPLLLLLLFAAVVSALSGEWTDALIVLAIVGATVVIAYQREYSAQTAVAALRARVKTRSTVLRRGQPTQVMVEEVVPGDVVLLSAGSLVPADAVVLEATDCHVSEAVLTGESFPVEKHPGVSPVATPLARRTNCVFLGTNVRSGTARCLIVATGRSTEFGAIAHRLSLRPPETEFDRGIRRFGYLLTSAMLVMVLLVFVAHVFRGRPPVETLLFAIALAVCLSPELLPAILSVNLARGAQIMAGRGVLVRRLNAIENLGSMDVLCTDKTGTLTAGVVELEGAYDPGGTKSPEVLELGALNAALETGLPSPLDDAILEAHRPESSRVRRFIARFMIEFGALSSLFDFLTFGILLGLFHAPPELFRTAWFIESLLTELVIALVVRTRRPFFRSRPGALLLWSTLVLIVVAFAVPYLPQVRVLGFMPLPGTLLAALAAVTVLYVAAAEVTKAWFYRHTR